MIYIKLRNVNLPATVTNKRTDIANRLVDDLIKKIQRGEISSFFSGLVTDTKGICETGSGVPRNFVRGEGGSTNSVEDRENGDLGAVAP